MKTYQRASRRLRGRESLHALLRISCAVLIGLFLVISMGCSAKKYVKIRWFLSDYSRLEVSNGSLRYLDAERLRNYSKFIIEPVSVRLYREPSDSRPDPVTSGALANYLHNAVIDAISDRYMIVAQPGPGVARMRIAITDLDKSTPALNVLPQTKLVGAGLGGAAMEAELLDSQTGEQIGALVEGRKGSRISFSGKTEWGDAESVMDEWAERFRKRIDEAHGFDY